MRRRIPFLRTIFFFRRASFASSLLAAAGAALLSACGSTPLAPPAAVVADAAPASRSSSAGEKAVPALPKASSGRGAYYQDDGPGDNIPEGLMDTPDAEPKVEPYSRRGNKPYVVFGKTYTPITHDKPFKQRGIGSWYGKKFHGQKTSSGELYDMYKMTAAHPTLPIPSYARVTNLANGKRVIVRVNDRGPFHANRIIDLSFTAALKLGYLGKGSGELEVERLLPEDIARLNASRGALAEDGQLAEGAIPVEVPAPAPVVAHQGAQSGNEISTNAAPVLTASSSIGAAEGALGKVYLQLGAYSQAANAEAARAQLAQAWTGGVPVPEVVQSGSLYRLQSGPFANRAEAEAAIRQLKILEQAKAVIVQR